MKKRTRRARLTTEQTAHEALHEHMKSTLTQMGRMMTDVSAFVGTARAEMVRHRKEDSEHCERLAEAVRAFQVAVVAADTAKAERLDGPTLYGAMSDAQRRQDDLFAALAAYDKARALPGTSVTVDVDTSAAKEKLYALRMDALATAEALQAVRHEQAKKDFDALFQAGDWAYGVSPHARLHPATTPWYEITRNGKVVSTARDGATAVGAITAWSQGLPYRGVWPPRDNEGRMLPPEPAEGRYYFRHWKTGAFHIFDRTNDDRDVFAVSTQAEAEGLVAAWNRGEGYNGVSPQQAAAPEQEPAPLYTYKANPHNLWFIYKRGRVSPVYHPPNEAIAAGMVEAWNRGEAYYDAGGGVTPPMPYTGPTGAA